MIVLDLPDVPRWIEAHGIAGDPHGWSEPVQGGAIVGHDAAKLAVVVGDADASAVAEVARERPQHTFLFAIEREDVAAALRTRGVERAILHELPDPSALPELEGAAPLGDAALDHVLGHVPAPLAAELAWAKARGPVWAAWVEGAPVSFAYAPWRSAKWFDVSVDTLATARQLGLATIVAAAMIREERARGREPVWGADEDNAPSLRLAKRLGFVQTDEIFVAAGR